MQPPEKKARTQPRVPDAISLPGHDKGLTKINQDRFVIDANRNLFMVVDGHGPGGEQVADYVARALPRHLATSLWEQAEHRDVRKAILIAFEKTSKYVSSHQGWSAKRCGAVVAGVFLYENKIWSFNLGDCRAVLCDGDGKAVDLTKDHQPGAPDERKRLTEAGAEIQERKKNLFLVREPSTGQKQRRMSIRVSRRFGDKQSRRTMALSDVPEIHVRDLSHLDRFLVLASDGVWKHLTSDAVIKLVHEQQHRYVRSSDAVLKAALHKWSACSYRDDITVMVVSVSQFLL